MKKCCDFQERITLVIKDASDRLSNDLVGPLTTFVDGQASVVKDACRKVDKTQEKRRHASVSLSSASSAQTLSRSASNKADMKAMELIVRFSNSASIECIKMFLLLFKSSSFVATFYYTSPHHNTKSSKHQYDHNINKQGSFHCWKRSGWRDGSVQ